MQLGQAPIEISVRVIDDVALVVAELLEDVDVKIEETDRSE